ncbi:hypothetical protein K7X08_032991 [Anisodus acutangulus]|uniref:Uncharacterized protein n=1 Tax=Anisodus acutangulus TaxID=402998 RepID=A0A9Q1RBK7_9SOLA|nr:hypothetical protein K7X08_032991 [Anisodus acutangulus]
MRGNIESWMNLKYYFLKVLIRITRRKYRLKRKKIRKEEKWGTLSFRFVLHSLEEYIYITDRQKLALLSQIIRENSTFKQIERYAESVDVQWV